MTEYSILVYFVQVVLCVDNLDYLMIIIEEDSIAGWVRACATLAAIVAVVHCVVTVAATARPPITIARVGARQYFPTSLSHLVGKGSQAVVRTTATLYTYDSHHEAHHKCENHQVRSTKFGFQKVGHDWADREITYFW